MAGWLQPTIHSITPINAHTMLFYFCCGCCIRSFIAHLHTYYSRCVHACRCTLLRDHDAADCWSRNLRGCISRFSLVLIVPFDAFESTFQNCSGCISLSVRNCYARFNEFDKICKFNGIIRSREWCVILHTLRRAQFMSDVNKCY